jgi:hypothetical protein
LTLVPLDSNLVRGVEGKPPALAVVCGKPGCNRFASERHHLWPKSWLRGQPYEWVVLPNGDVIENSVGLCTLHHGHITGEVGGHKARILLFEDNVLQWHDRNGDEWTYVGILGDSLDHQDEERCPTCGHVKQQAKPLAKRPAKSWNVTVPDDEEDGAVVLDSYVEDFAGIFGFADKSARLRRYHVLARVLQWASVNRIDLIREWEETEV